MSKKKYKKINFRLPALLTIECVQKISSILHILDRYGYKTHSYPRRIESCKIVSKKMGTAFTADYSWCEKRMNKMKKLKDVGKSLRMLNFIALKHALSEWEDDVNMSFWTWGGQMERNEYGKERYDVEWDGCEYFLRKYTHKKITYKTRKKMKRMAEKGCDGTDEIKKQIELGYTEEEIERFTFQ